MLIIRPTKSLLKKMKAQYKNTDLKESTTLLGDWYANDIILDKRQYIICMCEKARLPFLVL